MSYQAAAYDSDLSESLLQKGEELQQQELSRCAVTQHIAADKEESRKSSNTTRHSPFVELSTIIIGVNVGVSLELSTLIVNYLMVWRFGNDFLSENRMDTFIFSYLWSLFASSVAVGFALNPIQEYLEREYLNNQEDDASDDDEDDDDADDDDDSYVDMKSAVDLFFAIGVMIGAVGLWFLGLERLIVANGNIHVMYFLSSLYVVLGIIRAMESFSACSSSTVESVEIKKGAKNVVVQDMLIV